MSTPVNLDAVHAMGAQFKENVFSGVAKNATRISRQLTRGLGGAAVQTPGTSTNFRTVSTGPRGARPVSGVVSSSRQPAAALGTAPRALGTGKIAAPYTPGMTVNSMTQSARAIGSGRSPIATPYQAPARVIPMSSNAALTNRVSPTMKFSDGTSQSPINRTAFNQPSQTPFKVNTISNPTPVQTPTAQPVQQFSSAPKPQTPYPLHTPPAGSSTQPLPRLTAAQSQPGRPNEFVVGSRNAKPGGIAAMGSQLEAWAQRRQSEIRTQRKTPPTQ